MNKSTTITCYTGAFLAFIGACLVAYAIPTATPENVGLSASQGELLLGSMIIGFVLAGGLFAAIPLVMRKG